MSPEKACNTGFRSLCSSKNYSFIDIVILVIKLLLGAIFIHRCCISYAKWRKGDMTDLVSQEIKGDTFMPPQITVCPRKLLKHTNMSLRQSYEHTLTRSDVILEASLQRNISGSLTRINILEDKTLALDNLTVAEVWREEINANIFGGNSGDEGLDRCQVFQYPKPIIYGRNGKVTLVFNMDPQLIRMLWLFITEKNQFIPTINSATQMSKPYKMHIPDIENPAGLRAVFAEYTVTPSVYIHHESCHRQRSTYADIKRKIYEKLNCTPFWDVGRFRRGPAPCPENVTAAALSNAYKQLGIKKNFQELERYGIYLPCRVTRYNVEQDFLTYANATSYRYRLKLIFNTYSVTVHDAVPAYNGGDFIADVGGYLGLLLGYSCLSAAQGIAKHLGRLWGYTRKG